MCHTPTKHYSSCVRVLSASSKQPLLVPLGMICKTKDLKEIKGCTEPNEGSGIYYLLATPHRSPKPYSDLGLFLLASHQRALEMMKITANPTWQWSNTKSHSSPTSTRRNNAPASLPDIKQALLPRSLDVSFALSYRR